MIFCAALPDRWIFTSVFLVPCWTIFTSRPESWSSADLTSRHFNHYYTSFTHFNCISFGTATLLKYVSFGTALNLSLSHIAIDGQSVCLSWCWALSGAHDQILVTVWQFLFCPWGAPSLMRGWVCLLSESVSSNKSIVHYVQLYTFYMFYMIWHSYTIYTRPRTITGVI
jgi:hypothetical protein